MTELTRRKCLLVMAVDVAAVAAFVSGCGSSGGSSGGGAPPPAGGGGTTTTTVAAALAARYGTPVTRQTAHGNKITSVGPVSGENIVYTVNNVRIDTVRPEDYQVSVGQVVDVFDLVSGSRASFLVS